MRKANSVHKTEKITRTMEKEAKEIEQQSTPCHYAKEVKEEIK